MTRRALLLPASHAVAVSLFQNPDLQLESAVTSSVPKSLVLRAKQFRSASACLRFSKSTSTRQLFYIVTNTGAGFDDSLAPSLSRLDLHTRSFLLDRVIIKRTLVHLPASARS
jgi:hypothetical protein